MHELRGIVGQRTWRSAIVAVVVLVLLTACAAGTNHLVGTGAQSGFWAGLWQGAICPVTFVVSLFNPHVAVYEVHNSGHWYDLGFLLGASITFSNVARSSTAGARRTRRPPADPRP